MQGDQSIVDPANQPIVKLKNRSIVLPDRRRLAINLKLDTADPQFAIPLQLGDLPFRMNNWDLVLMTKNYYLFENRWQFVNELVDYRVVQFWDIARFDVNLQSLRKIKIYGLLNELPSTAQIDLLMILGSCTSVRHLEIDVLDLIEHSETDLSFKSLRLLSIDTIRVVTKSGQEALQEGATLWLVAPQLETVYSGSNSIDFIVFADCNVRSLFIQGCLTLEEFATDQFANLQNLTCSEIIRQDQMGVLRQIAQGELLSQLETLSCNFNNLKSTTYKLGLVERVLIREFYERLASGPPLKKNLQIYIHGLRFERNRPYELCGYHLNLIQFHFKNTGGRHEVQPCASVSKVDYIDALDTFIASEVGTGTFFTYYPNLRTVILDNEARRRQISSLNLISFLSSCAGLTELELRFANVDLRYLIQIAQLPSLAKLHSFVLLERPLEFAQSIHFRTVVNQFEDLRNFNTNLATRPVMLWLLERMRIGAHFVFDFWLPDNTYNRCMVLRRRDTYNLLVELQSNRDCHELYRKTFTSLPYLLKALTEPNPKFSLQHWLDNVRPA